MHPIVTDDPVELCVSLSVCHTAVIWKMVVMD